MKKKNSTNDSTPPIEGGKNCKYCYGKQYYSVWKGVHGSPDFPGDPTVGHNPKWEMIPCPKCGKQGMDKPLTLEPPIGKNTIVMPRNGVESWEDDFIRQFCVVGRNWLLNSADNGIGLKLHRDIVKFIHSLLHTERKKWEAERKSIHSPEKP